MARSSTLKPLFAGVWKGTGTPLLFEAEGSGDTGGRAFCGRPSARRWDAAGTMDPTFLSLRSGGAGRQEALGFWKSVRIIPEEAEKSSQSTTPWGHLLD